MRSLPSNFLAYYAGKLSMADEFLALIVVNVNDICQKTKGLSPLFYRVLHRLRSREDAGGGW